MKNNPLFSRDSIGCRALSLFLSIFLVLSGTGLPVRAAGTDPAPVTQSEETASAGWPAAPFIHAPAAILVEIESGAVLYGKNIHKRHYPASVTKLLTALIAYEKLGLEDTISPSEDTFEGLPWDSSMAGFERGQTFTVKDVLYGMIVSSGNDAANMLAEKAAGSKKKFPDLMNERARELGCLDSNFANAHGIHDPDHYTSVYDMAQIARAYFSYEDLSRIAGTNIYTAVSVGKKSKEIEIYSHNKLIQGIISLDGLVGSKTGYTDMARETLATCAEQDGMKLICIVMQDEPDNHYTDTVNLMKYGFENFRKVDISTIKTDVVSSEERFMTEGSDIMGSSISPMTLRSGSFAVIPSDGSESFITARIAEKNEYVNVRDTLKKPLEGHIPAEGEKETETEKKKTKKEKAEEAEEISEEESGDEKEEDAVKVLGAVRYSYGVNVAGYADIIYTPGKVEQTGSADSEKNGIIHAGRSGSFYIYLPGFLIGIAVITLITIVILMIRAHKKYILRKNSMKKKVPGENPKQPQVRKVRKAPSSDKVRKRPK